MSKGGRIVAELSRQAWRGVPAVQSVESGVSAHNVRVRPVEGLRRDSQETKGIKGGRVGKRKAKDENKR